MFQQPKQHFQKQIGIVRVNCVDSLDRTNVFLRLIGKSMLLRQLKQIELIEPATTSLEKFHLLKILLKISGLIMVIS